jgi:hypothetical protein
MPDGTGYLGYRDAPRSPGKPGAAAYRGGPPGSSTNRAPSSPRRASGGSPRPVQTPRSRMSAPGTPRTGIIDVADRNVVAAKDMAESIPFIKDSKKCLLVAAGYSQT